MHHPRRSSLYTEVSLRTNQRIRKRFWQIVGELSVRKAPKLFGLFDPAPGKLPKLTRKWRDKKVAILSGLVEQGNLPALRRWVNKSTEKAEVRFGGRVPKNDKAIVVKDSLIARGHQHRHLVYVSFGRRRRCLKVGRSDNGLDRIANQWSQYYFRDARRVAVYFPNKRKTRMLPALECALTHLFPPFHSYQKPSKRKYAQKCLACQQIKFVERTLRKLFPA